MKISLIDNGLDSLLKGYEHLGKYGQLFGDGADEAKRFSALKDSVLSIQHGIEILVKYILKKENELLIYTDISKLKIAFQKRRLKEIVELFEADGVHTVTYRESLERLRDICGIDIRERLWKTLLKVEKWRNSITHSAVLLNEDEVSNVIVKLLDDLDDLFGPLIGEEYLKGQERTDLDRAYRVTKAVYGKLSNDVKAATIECLISALQKNEIKGTKAQDAILIEDPQVAHSILKEIQEGGLTFGCDLINGHCSGHAVVLDLAEDSMVTIYTSDNECGYQFKLSGMMIYIPELNNDVSPLVFMYSDNIPTLGEDPHIVESKLYQAQLGLMLDDGSGVLWEKAEYEQSYEEVYSDEPVLPAHKEVFRFLSAGAICFMNIQRLDYPKAAYIFKETGDAQTIHTIFKDLLGKMEKES